MNKPKTNRERKVNNSISVKCTCECCSPAVTDAELFAHLDKLARSQWRAADLLLYADFPISRERSKKVAKAWLRRAVVFVPPRYACSEKTFV